MDSDLAAVWTATRAATDDVAVAEDVTVAAMTRHRHGTSRSALGEAVRQAVALAPSTPFDSLAPDERESLALARLAGLDVDEIAELVGADAATIRRRLTASLRALAAQRVPCA